MKLYIQILKLLFNKFALRKSSGVVVKNFAEEMGLVYIKLAQILATQNFGDLFTEEDRQILSSICDNCNPISYDEVEITLKQEYGTDPKDIFRFIERQPVGSASVSQVHRAILKTGEEVAVKVKRKDITVTIDKDIEKIRKLVHRFGRLVNFNNLIGGDHALDLYLEWIKQETDFTHEKANIKLYQHFADNVNGKVKNTTQIRLPKLYEKYCTDNVLVMEFIKAPTINKLELTSSNKIRIATALNSYLKLSFWALLNDESIVFHGDPHSGNICVDDEGNICFLDMGLLCAMSDSDANLCREFFLTAYSGNYHKLYKMLISYGSISRTEEMELEEDCKRYCENVKEKEITYYFVDLISVCLKYELDPPDFLFSMAKAFVCLNGISNFSNNTCVARELLQEQTMEFLIRRSLKDCQGILSDGLSFAPRILESILQNGLVSTIAKATTDNTLRQDVKNSLANFREMLDLLEISQH